MSDFTDEFYQTLGSFLDDDLKIEVSHTINIDRIFQSCAKIDDDNKISYYYRLVLKNMVLDVKYDVFYVANNKDFIGGKFFKLNHLKECDGRDCQYYNCFDNCE
jgi:hypothetical protein